MSWIVIKYTFTEMIWWWCFIRYLFGGSSLMLRCVELFCGFPSGPSGSGHETSCHSGFSLDLCSAAEPKSSWTDGPQSGFWISPEALAPHYDTTSPMFERWILNSDLNRDFLLPSSGCVQLSPHEDEGSLWFSGVFSSLSDRNVSVRYIWIKAFPPKMRFDEVPHEKWWFLWFKSKCK